MRENLSHTIEDYLKIIYELTADEGRATTKRIAARLGVTPASVTGMLKRLANSDPALVEYRKHRGVLLTPAGRQVALEIIRHHRLLELFLHETLGYTWDEVHAEADRLEHVISEDMEERIAQSLGNPLLDPHGEPIPSRDLHLPVDFTQRLNELRTGQQAVVQRVEDDDPEFLRYLHGIGITPNTHLTVLDYSNFDENLQIKVDDQVLVLGPAVTQQIYVEVK
ncbi:MAG TPA: metal-dependent transcriptional regulator [Anaerolineales bacterium]|nr:metal-dependent transcriptional regulator [Anaerolineales bacterium]